MRDTGAKQGDRIALRRQGADLQMRLIAVDGSGQLEAAAAAAREADAGPAHSSKTQRLAQQAAVGADAVAQDDLGLIAGSGSDAEGTAELGTQIGSWSLVQGWWQRSLSKGACSGAGTGRGISFPGLRMPNLPGGLSISLLMLLPALLRACSPAV